MKEETEGYIFKTRKHRRRYYQVCPRCPMVGENDVIASSTRSNCSKSGIVKCNIFLSRRTFMRNLDWTLAYDTNGELLRYMRRESSSK